MRWIQQLVQRTTYLFSLFILSSILFSFANAEGISSADHKIPFFELHSQDALVEKTFVTVLSEDVSLQDEQKIVQQLLTEAGADSKTKYELLNYEFIGQSDDSESQGVNRQPQSIPEDSSQQSEVKSETTRVIKVPQPKNKNTNLFENPKDWYVEHHVKVISVSKMAISYGTSVYVLSSYKNLPLHVVLLAAAGPALVNYGFTKINSKVDKFYGNSSISQIVNKFKNSAALQKFILGAEKYVKYEIVEYLFSMSISYLQSMVGINHYGYDLSFNWLGEIASTVSVTASQGVYDIAVINENAKMAKEGTLTPEEVNMRSLTWKFFGSVAAVNALLINKAGILLPGLEIKAGYVVLGALGAVGLYKNKDALIELGKKSFGLVEDAAKKLLNKMICRSSVYSENENKKASKKSFDQLNGQDPLDAF
jgi:hypothetical protein